MTAGILSRLMAERQRILRFLVIGSMNTAFSYGIYAVCIAIGMVYFLANLVALVCGIIVGFQAQKRFVFKASSKYSFYYFLAIWGLLYCFNSGLIGLLIHYAWSPYAAGAIALLPTTVFSYLLQRFVVFRPSVQDKRT